MRQTDRQTEVHAGQRSLLRLKNQAFAMGCTTETQRPNAGIVANQECLMVEKIRRICVYMQHRIGDEADVDIHTAT